MVSRYGWLSITNHRGPLVEFLDGCETLYTLLYTIHPALNIPALFRTAAMLTGMTSQTVSMILCIPLTNVTNTNG